MNSHTFLRQLLSVMQSINLVLEVWSNTQDLGLVRFTSLPVLGQFASVVVTCSTARENSD